MTCARLAMCIAAIATAGCAPASYLGTLVARDMVPPAYDLENRHTLVMVDDPHQHLGSGVTANVVADRIMNDLKQREIVTPFVPLAELQTLADELGEDYPATPIDLIGQRLSAAQVIYVKIDAVRLFAEPSMLRPQARTEVKVIDAERSVRLFPPPGAQTNGRMVVSELTHRYGDNADPGDSAMLMREFANRIGRDVGRLFYEYEADPPGHTLTD